MASLETLKSRRPHHYPFHVAHHSRWSDNDMYSHVNNSIYIHLFDTVVNTYLIRHCNLHPPTSPQIGLVVHSHCDYMAPVSFPVVLDLGLRVRKVGQSSVVYEIGIFEEGDGEVKAVGEFVHVFVERGTMKPSVKGMNEELRKGLERLAVTDPEAERDRDGGGEKGKAKL